LAASVESGGAHAPADFNAGAPPAHEGAVDAAPVGATPDSGEVVVPTIETVLWPGAPAADHAGRPDSAHSAARADHRATERLDGPEPAPAMFATSYPGTEGPPQGWVDRIVVADEPAGDVPGGARDPDVAEERMLERRLTRLVRGLSRHVTRLRSTWRDLRTQRDDDRGRHGRAGGTREK
jgi:hypothetical protein